ncbi:MAG: lactococcin 972 family bacteriocin [Erysipelotrichia bacterium]|nr:lactococcin 972 family bacteriocin [Erysipelotrichia bacterium]
MKKTIIKMMLGITMLGTTVVAVSALTTTHPYGGTWTQGIRDNTVISNFLHNKHIHRATAVGTRQVFDGWKSPGVWAKASAPKAFAGNKTYYSFPDGTVLYY